MLFHGFGFLIGGSALFFRSGEGEQITPMRERCVSIKIENIFDTGKFSALFFQIALKKNI